MKSGRLPISLRVLLPLVGLTVVNVAVFIVNKAAGNAEETGSQVMSSRRVVRRNADGPVRRSVAKIMHQDGVSAPLLDGENRKISLQTGSIPPDPEEATLNELSKSVLSEIQQALDEGSLEKLQEIVARIRSYSRGQLGGRSSDGIPSLLKRRIVAALSQFGQEGIPELLAYLVDEDPTVSDFALSKFEMSLLDFSLGDAERADIIVQASTVLTDESTVSRILWNLMQTRHSVGVKAIVDISQSGTPEAQRALVKVMEMYTNGTQVETVEDLQAWFKDNPDGPYDEMLYGKVEVPKMP